MHLDTLRDFCFEYIYIYIYISIQKLLGYVWFPENVRERKLGGKMEGKKKLRK